MANDNVSALLSMKGGGGGSGEMNAFAVNFVETSGVWGSDKTFAETKAAYDLGHKVTFYIDSQFVGYASNFGPGGNVFSASFWNGNFATMAFTLIRFTASDIDVVTNFIPQEAEVKETLTGSTPTIDLAADNTLYIGGELTSLTVTAVPSSGIFELLFTSGNTATEVTLPPAVRLPAGFSFEADTIYDLSVRMYTVGGNTYGLAAVQGWPVPSA